MLTVVIGHRRQTIIDVTGLRFRTFPMYYQDGEGLLRYFNERESYAGIEGVELYMMRRGWWRLSIMPLPLQTNLHQAILTFLERYHAKQDLSFDCYAFASLYNGIALDDKRYLPLRWKCEPCEGQDITAGETIFLFGGEGCYFRHAAICLGEDRYLSVWGAGGDLEVASLKDMVSDFHATKIVAARPRPRE